MEFLISKVELSENDLTSVDFGEFTFDPSEVPILKCYQSMLSVRLWFVSANLFLISFNLANLKLCHFIFLLAVENSKIIIEVIDEGFAQNVDDKRGNENVTQTEENVDDAIGKNTFKIRKRVLLSCFYPVSG